MVSIVTKRIIYWYIIILLIPLLVNAMEVNIEHAGSVDYVYGSKKIPSDKKSGLSPTKRQADDVTCDVWNRQILSKSLVSENGNLVGKSTEARELSAYVNGVLTALDCDLSKDSVSEITKQCKDTPRKKLAKVISCNICPD